METTLDNSIGDEDSENEDSDEDSDDDQEDKYPKVKFIEKK